MNVTFIVNKRAGNFNGKRAWLKLKKQLTIPYTFYETQHAGHAYELVQQLAQLAKNQLVIVIGGDGTVHEVVNAVANMPHIIVGYVKGGSGNDFARAFPSFEAGADIERFLAQQHCKHVDSGRITFQEQTTYFINNFGIGFDAYVCQLVNESKLKRALNKLKLGKVSYAIFVVQALLQFKPFTLTVEYNGKVHVYERVWFATVSNQPYFGGGMNLSPQSIVDDGMLEITVVSRLARLKFLTLFLTVFKAKHTRFKEVTQFQANDVSFTVQAPTPIHTDGENKLLTTASVRCEIAPKSIIIAT